MLLKNPLDTVLGQVSKVKILRFLIKTGEEFTGREMARAVGLSHVRCNSALQELFEHGLITMRKVGRAFLYGPNENNLLLRDVLKPLFEKEARLLDKVRKHILEEFAGAKPESIVLFGSTARGDSRPDSDIDVLVVIPDEMSINTANRHLERAADKISLEFGNPLAYIVKRKKDFQKGHRKGRVLYLEIAETGKRLHGMSVSEVLGDVG